MHDGVPRSLSVRWSDCCAEPVPRGLFRELLPGHRVGDRLLGYTCVHDDNWLVDVREAEPGDAGRLFNKEYEFVSANPFAEALKPVFDLA